MSPQKSGQFKHLGLAFNRWWSITALVLSLAMLATAWSFQLFAHFNPCHLCLKQRDIYWISVGVSLVASVWALFTGAKGAPRVFSFVLFAIFATGFAIALFHAGVELKWWRGPMTCTVSNSELSPDKMMSFLAGGGGLDAPRCDVAAWRMWGLSMAGYNAIASGILALLSLFASLRFRPKRRPFEMTGRPPPRPGHGATAARTAEMLRVDHAGELAAVHIYRGQSMVFGETPHKTLANDFKRMEGEEQVHLDAFESLLRDRHVRPTVMTPVWRLAALGLGIGTALLGEKAAHACTEAVESVIEEHYADQIDEVATTDPDLAARLTQFRNDELGHHDHAVDNGARDAIAYPLLTGLIKTGCRLAIRISEKI